MKCNPKISVIIPIYNEEQYLNECLESVRNQTLKEIEIICVDDGSTDNSMAILQNMKNKDDRFIILQQKNCFAGCARNNGLSIARGDFLLFLDADDIFESNMFEKMYSSAVKSDADVVICEYSIIDGKIISFDKERGIIPSKEVFSADMLENAAVFQVSTGVAWNKLFKKDFINNLGIRFQNLRCSNDGYFVYMAMMCARKITYIYDRLLKYRLGNRFSLSGTREKSWINAFEMLRAIKDSMLEMGIYNKYEKSYLNYALTHSIGYLGSIHSINILRDCYSYIKKNEESCFNILDKPSDFYYELEYYKCYENICKLPFETFIDFEIYGRKLLSPVILFWTHNYIKNKNLAIYGAGQIGKLLYFQIGNSDQFKEVMLFDRRYNELKTDVFPVENPQKMTTLDIDYVFIAIKDEKLVKETLLWIDEWKDSKVMVYCL